MEDKEIYKIQRHIQHLAARIRSLQIVMSEKNPDINIAWDEEYTKQIQDDKILDELEKRLGL